MPDWILYTIIGVLAVVVIIGGVIIWALASAASAGAELVDGIMRGFIR
jgi:hypothetical protein